MPGLVDSTLREGSQAPVAYLTSPQRLALLAQVLRIGVEEVELGHAVTEPAYRPEPLADLLEVAARLRPGVRRAIAASLDRGALTTAAFPAGSVVPTHLTPCVVAGACEGTSWYEFNAPAAVAALAAAGFDLEAGNLQAVKDGHVDYVMSPGHWLAGYIATRALANAKETGEPLIQGLLLVPGELVSAENVAAVIARQQSADTVAAALAPIGDAVLADPAKHIVGPWPPG